MQHSAFVKTGIILALVCPALVSLAGYCADRPSEGGSPGGAAEKGVADAKVSAGKMASGRAIPAARQWLNLLKAKEGRKLAQATDFPFVYETTNKKKTCERTAADAKGLEAIVACLANKDKLLLGELDRAGVFEFKDIQLSEVPKSLREFVRTPVAGEKLLMTFINGDGVTFEFVLLVRPGSQGKPLVGGMFVNAEFETG